jgi:copper homeostasis protein
MNFRLEICSGSVESAIAAQLGGADRVELCDNLYEGGTTPSAAAIESAKRYLTIPVHVIIRPRGGDFLYSETEFDIMRRDIEFCGENGVDGVVFGLLNADGSVDLEKCAELAEFAAPMSVTFHRAFDMCNDPFRALEDIISAGAHRILTSGLKNSAPEGSAIIAELIRKAGSRIIIMPGGGINESNVAEVARTTGAIEFHMSARKTYDSLMAFRRDGVLMGGIAGIPEYSKSIADPERIKNIINILKMI